MSDNKAAEGCLTLILALVLVSQVCSFISHPVHHWKDATCTEPQTCVDCGKTKGEPLGHDLVEATCQHPAICKVCGAEVGINALHRYSPATCTEPKTCIVCGHTALFSSPLGHQWVEANCYLPKTCSVCGATEGEPEHLFDSSWTVIEEPTCQTEGQEKNVCLRCSYVGVRTIPIIDHQPGDWQTIREPSPDSNGLEARYCTICGLELDTYETAYLPMLSGGAGGSGSNFNRYNNESQQKTSATYVLNTSTHVFHRPSCRDVKRIAAQNYSTSSASRDDVLSLGYRPCGHCSP